MHTFSNEDRRRRLVVRHRLDPERRCATPEDVVDAVLAIHSSDPATVFLSIAARSADASIATIENSLYDRRTLVRHHAFRRTLWVMRPAFARAAHGSAGAKVAAVERRNLLRIVAASPATGCSDVDDAARWCREALDTIRSFIDDNGPTTTREIGRQFPELTVKLQLGMGTKHAGEAAAHTRVLLLAGFEADLVRTAPSNGWNTAEYAWAATNNWLEKPLAGMAVDDAATSVLQPWLERFGPATETDIKWWTGWTATQMRAALRAIDAEPVLVEDGDAAWIAAGDRATTDHGPSIALLPGLDVATMGWKERSWYVSPAAIERTFDRWSNAGPTVWRNGEVVGGWAHRPDGSVAIELFSELTAHERRLLDDEVERFVSLVSETQVKMRFPAPNQPALLRTDQERLDPARRSSQVFSTMTLPTE